MHRPISEEGPSLLPSAVISGMSQCARKSNSGLTVVQCNRRRRGVAARWGGADRLSQPEREPIVVSDGGEAPASRSYGIKCPQGRGIHQGQKKDSGISQRFPSSRKNSGKKSRGHKSSQFPPPPETVLKNAQVFARFNHRLRATMWCVRQVRSIPPPRALLPHTLIDGGGFIAPFSDTAAGKGVGKPPTHIFPSALGRPKRHSYFSTRFPPTPLYHYGVPSSLPI